MTAKQIRKLQRIKLASVRERVSFANAFAATLQHASAAMRNAPPARKVQERAAGRAIHRTIAKRLDQTR